MKRRCKGYKKALESIEMNKVYDLSEAVAILKQLPKKKFDESVDLAICLNLDPKQSEQMVRGTVLLPNGTGKTKKIAVFCKGEAENEAKGAGADFVGAQELIDKVAGGWLEFDVAVSTPEMMRDLSKLGKMLGPRGLMPSPKTGTVTNDIARAVKELKAGKIEYKSDKQAGIHIGIGKISFEIDKLIENITTALSAIKGSRPASVKGDFIKSISLSTTMSPGIKVVP